MRLSAVRIWKHVVDMAVISVAFWSAVYVRHDQLSGELFERYLSFWPFALLLTQFGCVLFRVTRSPWAYFSLHETLRLALALMLALTLLLGVNALTAGAAYSRGMSADSTPASILLLHCAFAFLAIAAVRSAARLRREYQQLAKNTGLSSPDPTLLIGAGRAGLLVVRELAAHPDLNLKPVGFLDDNSGKLGMLIHGVPVLGTSSEIETVLQRHEIKQVIITIASAPGQLVRRVTEACKAASIPLKTIPGVFEIVGGRVNLSRLRDVSIQDLLRRDPIVLDREAIAQEVQDRNILITGAGGSIGSELCRQICQFPPKILVLVDSSENSLFHIGRQLKERYPHVRFVSCLANICDLRRMHSIFKKYKPAVVFHAAAHKHVPMMEAQPCEAIKNNVFGTKNLADMCDEYQVNEFVMISTDKAINPTSVMGVSKRVAEIYIQALSQRSSTRFVTVRFGNVLGSAGSVVPIFEEQIARGGPITITHPEMKRYFMTIPEACQLVLQAASMGRGGEIFVLDMGEPVRIVELARDLIRLSGLRPDVDIQLKFTGMRPGEKLFEELSLTAEKLEKGRHPKILIGKFPPYPWAAVTSHLAELAQYVDCDDAAVIRQQFATIVPEYNRWISARQSAKALTRSTAKKVMHFAGNAPSTLSVPPKVSRA